MDKIKRLERHLLAALSDRLDDPDFQQVRQAASDEEVHATHEGVAYTIANISFGEWLASVFEEFRKGSGFFDLEACADQDFIDEYGGSEPRS